MKYKDIKIGTQLRTGLGFILFFVVILGSVAWFQAKKLWESTEGLYSHPLQVRRAVELLKSDVLLIHRSMKDIVLTSDSDERQAEIEGIAVLEADALKQIGRIKDAYLGPPDDVSEINSAVVMWRPIREKIISLMRDNRVKEAASQTTHKGSGGAQVDRILKEINDVSDFALKRADAFYEDARATREKLEIFLFMLLLLILAVTSVIMIILLRSIRKPLEEMIAVTEEYRNGNLDSRIGYSSGNEFGQLAESFNRLAEANKADIINREQLSEIANVMLKEEDLHSFCHNLLIVLMKFSGSQIGSVFLLNDSKNEYEHFESVGLNQSGCSSFSATLYEGEFGLALATQNKQVIRDIPTDTPMVFSTTSGDFRPREIVSIPIVSGSEVVAMVSLATLNPFSPEALRLIDDIHSTLTARFNGVLAHQKIIDFSEKLELQNRELDERAVELSSQSDELTEQNIELEMQKRQLDEANRLKSSFLSNMSHELRTPLNSVIALSGVLSRRLETTISGEEFGYLEIIERNGKNLLSLINDILDLSRIEAGKEELNIDAFNIFNLVDEIVSMIDQQARDKSISLLNRVPRDIPEIHSDYGKCRHILQNLIANAVKFTDKGKVEISAVLTGKNLRISVADTGIGIAETDLPYIFDEFRQADEGSSRKYGGTGLGLAIARKYAGLLQGEISVDSEPGKGSVFTLTIPLTIGIVEMGKYSVHKQKSHHSVNPSLARNPDAGKGKKILLVEDSEPAIIQIRETLAEQKYEVLVARNGKEALEQVGVSKPDAMILDLMMPEVDGFQVLKVIRDVKELSSMPVLILTAKHITKGELSFLKENNIYQFIQKGDIGRMELLATVNEMVVSAKIKTEKKQERFQKMNRTGKPIVLVVEDNPDNMKTVKAILHTDYIMLEAVDGSEGVKKAVDNNPDLILMDMSLPILDGFAAFDEIRKESRLSDTPIIALTASAMKGSREEILAYGFDDYIAKPIDEPSFRKVLDHYLDGEKAGPDSGS